MENELLTFEVRFLKAQLAEIERLRSRLEETERSVADLRSQLAGSERAKKDLVLLLRRLTNSPLGPLLRLKRGFRTLEQQYLSTDI